MRTKDFVGGLALSTGSSPGYMYIDMAVGRWQMHGMLQLHCILRVACCNYIVEYPGS